MSLSLNFIQKLYRDSRVLAGIIGFLIGSVLCVLFYSTQFMTVLTVAFVGVVVSLGVEELIHSSVHKKWDENQVKFHRQGTVGKEVDYDLEESAVRYVVTHKKMFRSPWVIALILGVVLGAFLGYEFYVTGVVTMVSMAVFMGLLFLGLELFFFEREWSLKLASKAVASQKMNALIDYIQRPLPLSGISGFTSGAVLWRLFYSANIFDLFALGVMGAFIGLGIRMMYVDLNKKPKIKK